MQRTSAIPGLIIEPQGIKENDDSDGTHVLSQASPPSHDGESLDPLDKKRLKTLKRMYPPGMLPELISEGTSRNHKHNRSTYGSSDESAPLQPGQSKTRRVRNVSMIDIRGDTESSDDEPVQKTQNELIDWGFLPQSSVTRPWPKHQTSDRPVVRELNDSSSSSGPSSLDGVDDDDIQTYLYADYDAPARERNLIDWMLTRTRTIGNKKSKARIRKPKKRRKEFNITVPQGHRNQGHEHQTILDFERKVPNPTKLGLVAPRPTFDPEEYHPLGLVSDGQTLHPLHNRRRKKESRDTSGIYIFTSEGMRIITNTAISGSVDLRYADDNFALALSPNGRVDSVSRAPKLGRSVERHSSISTPQQKGKGRSFSRPTIIGSKPLSGWLSERECEPRRPLYHSTEITRFPSGIRFPPATWIAKGFLHDFLVAISPDAPATMPTWCRSLDLTFESTMGVEDYKRAIENLCEQASSLVDILEPDPPDFFHWRSIIPSATQHLTWLLVSSDDLSVRTSLIFTVQKSIANLVNKLWQEHTDRSNDSDESTLLICWFVVEMASRVQGASVNPTDPSLRSTLTLLVDRLVQCDIATVLKKIGRADVLEGPLFEMVVAEIWVMVIHLVLHLDARSTTGNSTLWTLVEESVTAHWRERNNLNASESLWQLIYGLSALSQFTKSGITGQKVQLPADWRFACFILNRVRLAAEASLDDFLSPMDLNKRDEYVSLVVHRCQGLHQIWGWKLDSSSPITMFNVLLEIFRSRKFANLRHEQSDFPEFMRSNDWDLLFTANKSDTAFMVFWKLVIHVHQRKENDTNHQHTLLPKIRQLLSRAIPVGSFPFSKINPPSMHDLSMLFNRLSAVAIAIYLDPQFTSRIRQARQYTSFATADDTTRSAIMRGVMCFAILLVNRQMGLQEISGWLEEMVTTLMQDYMRTMIVNQANEARTQQSSEISPEKARLLFSFQLLLGSIRKIFDAFQKNKLYPDSTLLGMLSEIIRTMHFTIICSSELDANTQSQGNPPNGPDSKRDKVIVHQLFSSKRDSNPSTSTLSH